MCLVGWDVIPAIRNYGCKAQRMELTGPDYTETLSEAEIARS